MAVIRGHDEVVKLLVTAADIEAKGRYWGETLLLLAAVMGRIDILEVLLRAGADVSATIDGVKETAIMWAINAQSVEIVERLSIAGADVNAQDAQGRTALHYALERCSFKVSKRMLEVLLSAGADINIHCTAKGDTPLHAASCIDLQDKQYEMELDRVASMFQTVNELYAVRRAVRTTCIPKHAEVEGHDELAEIINVIEV